MHNEYTIEPLPLSCYKGQDKMAARVDNETEANRLSSSYAELEDTVETDVLVPIREHTPKKESNTSGSLKRRRKLKRRVYDVLASSTELNTPRYVKDDTNEDPIAYDCTCNATQKVWLAFYASFFFPLFRRARLKICRKVESLPARLNSCLCSLYLHTT